jgi:cobaltochelatase CobN
MHRIATQDSPEYDLSFEPVEQTCAPIIILTAADTDIQTIASCLPDLPVDFPAIRVLNLLKLSREFAIDDYAERVINKAQVIILRILGGISYWAYGLEVIKEIAGNNGASLFVMPGDDQEDPHLISQSSFSPEIVKYLWQYFTEGGRDNLTNALKFVSDKCFASSFNPPKAQIIPKIGIYKDNKGPQRVGILFYRSHYLSGNLAPIDALCLALESRNIASIAIYLSSLRDLYVQSELIYLLQDAQLILNTTSFSLAQLGKEEINPLIWQQLNLPIFQVILSSSKHVQWQTNTLGLMPSDLAMNVVLPEVDGRIITRAISFKEQLSWHSQLETDIVIYQPNQNRVDFVADTTRNWLKLKNTAPDSRKIALILANYPTRDGRIANGVGLDTPQSCLEILQALQTEGYHLENLPPSGDELINRLKAGITNDPENDNLRLVTQTLPIGEYLAYFVSLPEPVKHAMEQRWGIIDETSSDFALSGVCFGNVFVGIQPSRGYEKDPSLNYHAGDLEPTHQYLAYYLWLKNNFGAQAIIHLGKHGNLEWLPGKGVALSENCYPEIALGSLPNFYPFIVNDPGEGTQAKRRASALILDHLTPPMTRAELYGDLQRLESLIDEYYQAESLDPKRTKVISSKIKNLIKSSNIEIPNRNLAGFLSSADAYLCELKEAQIRDGLHILGNLPTGRQLRDLVIAIARYPTWQRMGLIPAIAQDLGLDFNPLLSDKGDPFLSDFTSCPEIFRNCRLAGDVLSTIEEYAQDLVEQVIEGNFLESSRLGSKIISELDWIAQTLLPSLDRTKEEISNLLKGLNGEYLPAGPSGAPTRGRPDVLPTGRNFYSVDIRSVPTETAWDMGAKAAYALIERYCQEHGSYPKTLAISIWGTATMRNAGEDFAQVLALMGVKPVWDGPSRRVVNFEILKSSVLGRPRVDVTVRVSGFFRDSFPTLLNLLDQVINAVANLDESTDINPLIDQVGKDTELWVSEGLSYNEAKQKATYRIFSSKPGSYGAGLQGLIEAQNWNDIQDLASAYLNWSSYAYSSSTEYGIVGNLEKKAFEQRLKNTEIVLQNQDNREHDLLDSDDYYQFQGGLTASIKALTDKNPEIYFGDNSVLGQPKIKTLGEELAKVYRSRVVNPKWISGMMRHGYKGAFEMAATVDYLFAYDATTGKVQDYMYQGITEAYLLNPQVQNFIKEKNPNALRDIAERLLEASQRGLWQGVGLHTLEQLKDIIHQAEEIIEGVN